MKIIILDIDGVLNVYRQERDEFGQLFHQAFVDNLGYIIEQTGAKIVVSSSWRSDGIIFLRNMWNKRGYPGEIIDITPNEYDLVKMGLFKYYDEVCRGHEIKYWLDNNKEKLDITSYVILDDDDDVLKEQLPYFVKCSNNKEHPDSLDIGYGLTKQCSLKAIEILNGR